jgi:hypothetical protein
MRVPKRQQNPGLQNNGVCGPGPGGQQTSIGQNNSSQLHHDVVYGATRGDLHCNPNQ